MESLRDTIARVAREEGIDPAYALAVAERESSFNPNASGVGSIRGLYQFTGANRRKYGLADNASPEEQTRAFAAFTRDNRREMAERLGREPTHGETYLGHFWGAGRAARVAAGHHADLAPSDLFTARELAGNPQLARGRTGGELAQAITGDIDRRMARHGGAETTPVSARLSGGGVDFAQYGRPIEQDDHRAAPGNARAEPGHVDFAQFGQPISSSSSNEGAKINTAPGAVDFSAFGQPMTGESPAMPAAMPLTPSPGNATVATPSPGLQLKNLEDEMVVRQNSPDPADSAFQGTVQQLQPQPQRI